MIDSPAPIDVLHCLVRPTGATPSLRELADAGLDRLPMPASGRTLERWRMLAAVASVDLSLAKLYEGHTDALAILAELGGPDPMPGSLWGTWCAEPPDARLSIRADRHPGAGRVRLRGRKAWCSGAAQLSHAVVSGWDDDDRPWLAAVALKQPGMTVTAQGWPAVGMAASASVDVLFDDADALPVGSPGDYVARPGFWHGGAGIAACWHGGAAGIARDLRAHGHAGKSSAHWFAHLGAVNVALAASAALLRETAQWIDAHPADNAQTRAMSARLAAEDAAQSVLLHASRAMGAGPLCREARLARAVADLPIYLRQSHAERDLEQLGRAVLAERSNDQERAWMP